MFWCRRSRQLADWPSAPFILRSPLGALLALLLCGAIALAHEPSPSQTGLTQKNGHVHPVGATTPHQHPPAKEDTSAPGQPELSGVSEPTVLTDVHGSEQPIHLAHDPEAKTPDAGVVRTLLGLTLAIGIVLVFFARRSAQSAAVASRRAAE